MYFFTYNTTNGFALFSGLSWCFNILCTVDESIKGFAIFASGNHLLLLTSWISSNDRTMGEWKEQGTCIRKHEFSYYHFYLLALWTF